jgi:tRNA G18 (ribose-2'-O)-methylase SpoU
MVINAPRSRLIPRGFFVQWRAPIHVPAHYFMPTNVFPVTSIDDQRLLPYRDLRRTNETRDAPWFIAEGNKLVERLLASRFPTQSVFADEAYLAELLPHMPASVPIYVAPRKLLEATIGFNFHRGCLACGVRLPAMQLHDWSPRGERSTIVVCPDVQDPTNLGVVLRNCAAFGVDLVLLGDKCADPFSRRVLRVSMGAVLQLAIVSPRDLAADLAHLQREFGVRTIATVLDPAADLLDTAARPARMALLLGSEGHGLEAHWIDTADQRVTIPMEPGTDSLNVAVASGIFLYHYTRRAALY